MSGDAMGFAIRHAPFSGTTYTVYLCLADSANDLHGHQLWFAMGNLAAKARCSRRTAQMAMQEIVAAGLLEVIKPPFDEDGKPTGRPGLYRFLFPEGLPIIFDNRGAKSPRTLGGSSGSRCEESAHPVREEVTRGAKSPRTNPIEPKKNHWAASQKNEGQDRTAEAFFAKAERNNERIFGGRESTPEELEAIRVNGLAQIREIKRRRAEGRAS